jgi:hypothetical protein
MSNEDTNNIDLLSLFHYILCGITALFSCIPFIHVFVGLAIVSGKFFKDNNGSGPPSCFGWLFVIMGAAIILIGWSTAACMIIAGRKLKKRKNRIFCTVVAGIECMLMPLGTILGVFTLIALSKDSVRELFDQH